MTFSLSDTQKKKLLKLARQSIAFGLENGKPLQPSADHDFSLTSNGACFVTLTINGELRGCIGSLEARQPLVEDVCQNAFSSAFQDSRFPPLREEEFPEVHIEISVLTPLEEMEFTSEENLLQQIVPFEDGLVLQEGRRRGTFLPLVWDKLPDRGSFWSQLKLKAGLPPDYWSGSMRCFRYRTMVFEE
jgi:AmmeMemoRadiSam system protein A